MTTATTTTTGRVCGVGFIRRGVVEPTEFATFSPRRRLLLVLGSLAVTVIIHGRVSAAWTAAAVRRAVGPPLLETTNKSRPRTPSRPAAECLFQPISWRFPRTQKLNVPASCPGPAGGVLRAMTLRSRLASSPEEFGALL